MHTAEVSIPVDAARVDVLVRAVAIEAEDGPEGAEIQVRGSGAALQVTVRANDVSDLRAALNSTLRLVDAAQRTVG